MSSGPFGTMTANTRCSGWEIVERTATQRGIAPHRAIAEQHRAEDVPDDEHRRRRRDRRQRPDGVDHGGRRTGIGAGQRRPGRPRRSMKRLRNPSHASTVATVPSTGPRAHRQPRPTTSTLERQGQQGQVGEPEHRALGCGGRRDLAATATASSSVKKGRAARTPAMASGPSAAASRSGGAAQGRTGGDGGRCRHGGRASIGGTRARQVSRSGTTRAASRPDPGATRDKTAVVTVHTSGMATEPTRARGRVVLAFVARVRSCSPSAWSPPSPSRCRGRASPSPSTGSWSPTSRSGCPAASPAGSSPGSGPRNPLGWLLSAAAVCQASSATAGAVGGLGGVLGWSEPALRGWATVYAYAWPWSIAAFLPLALLVFPDGLLPGRAWRAAVATVLVSAVGVRRQGRRRSGRRHLDAAAQSCPRWCSPRPPTARRNRCGSSRRS